MMMMKKTKMGMEGLLPELQSNILSRLPVESLLQCRCVCKTWCSLIDDPFLRETHTERLLQNHGGSFDYGTVSFISLVRFQSDFKLQFVEYYYYDEEGEDEEQWTSRLMDFPPRPTNHPPYESFCYRGIVGSCNGLVCLGVYDNRNMFDHIYLFNPATRECLNLPSLSKEHDGRDAIPHGFGYDPCTKEYKVVRIHSGRKIDVYTLGSGEWRSMGDVPSMFSSLCPSHGVLSNGALHWIDYQGKIASFDLATEEFSAVPSPQGVSIANEEDAYFRLGVWGKSLCLIKYGLPKSIEIWVMNNGEQSWRKEINVPIEDGGFSNESDGKDEYRFITLAESGRVLFWYNKDTIISYDPVNEIFTTLDLNPNGNWFTAVLHTNSFVSMKALGERTKIIGQVRI